MRRQKGILPSLVSYLTFALVLVLSAEVGAAQTLTGSSAKLKIEPGAIEPAGAASKPVVATISSASSPKTASDPVSADAALMNARADVPKVQPAISLDPQPPVQCKRSINADVVAMAKPIML